MSATKNLITVMEQNGLTTDHEPSPEQWESMIKSDDVQRAIRKVGEVCDDEGVPFTTQVLEELSKFRQ